MEIAFITMPLYLSLVKLIFFSSLIVAAACQGQITPTECLLTDYNESSVLLYLYNNQYPAGTLYKDPSQLMPNKADTEVLAHGWTETKDAQWIQSLKDLIYTNNPSSNVFIVDYSQYSKLFYWNTWCRTGRIGQTLAVRLAAIQDRVTSFKARGFSLGAQVLGTAGRVLKIRGTKFLKVEGFDMAGPKFDRRLLPTFQYLDLSSADAVTIVITNGSPVGAGFITSQTVNAARIFFNGGWTQPGCDGLDSQCDFSSIDALKSCPIETVACSHFYAREVALKREAGTVYRVTQCDNLGLYLLGLCAGNTVYDYSNNSPNLPAGSYYTDADENANPI